MHEKSTKLMWIRDLHAWCCFLMTPPSGFLFVLFTCFMLEPVWWLWNTHARLAFCFIVRRVLVQVKKVRNANVHLFFLLLDIVHFSSWVKVSTFYSSNTQSSLYTQLCYSIGYRFCFAVIIETLLLSFFSSTLSLVITVVVESKERYSQEQLYRWSILKV